MYVDAGSGLFIQVVRNVPVLAPKNQAYVSREVREKSLETMAGVPHHEDKEEEEKLQRKTGEDEGDGLHQPEDTEDRKKEEAARVASVVKKRKLYRQLTGQEVPWFPHDNDIELVKELCWEAGRPRWVIFGTPASGAGIHGC